MVYFILFYDGLHFSLSAFFKHESTFSRRYLKFDTSKSISNDKAFSKNVPLCQNQSPSWAQAQ